MGGPVIIQGPIAAAWNWRENFTDSAVAYTRPICLHFPATCLKIWLMSAARLKHSYRQERGRGNIWDLFIALMKDPQWSLKALDNYLVRAWSCLWNCRTIVHFAFIFPNLESLLFSVSVCVLKTHTQLKGSALETVRRKKRLFSLWICTKKNLDFY